jgi:diadenosine tetraphosphatase ApaH/serine/threonine PP2A family protein phosphatase
LRDGWVRAHTGNEIFLHNDGYYLINPGTVGQPRTADRRATYLVLDTATWVVTVRRVAYEASVTLAKTRKAGLLPRYSYLPAPLRAFLRRSLYVLRLYGFVKRVESLIG